MRSLRAKNLLNSSGVAESEKKWNPQSPNSGCCIYKTLRIRQRRST